MVENGGTPFQATAATERAALVQYAHLLPQWQIDLLLPAIQEQGLTWAQWLAKLALRSTYLDNIALQLYADMRQQPITIFPDRLETGMTEVVPIVLQPRLQAGAVPHQMRFLLHRVEGDFFVVRGG